jgi:HAD superfamily hydrolase (TIGR01509 family)
MRAILWDLDGTLIDNDELHLRAWQQTLAAYAVQYDYAAFIAGFGRPNKAIVSEMFSVAPDDPLVAEVSLRKEQTYRTLLAGSELRLAAGVGEWLARFRQAGVLQVISSSGPMANIVATIHQLGVGDYFISLMSGATLPRGKPDPALFYRSAAASGVPPSACLVIEDSVHGIEAARRAGMGSVVVGRLVGSSQLAETLAAAPGPDCVAVRSLSELAWRQCEALWESAHERADGDR